MPQEAGSAARRMDRALVEACADCQEGDEVTVSLPSGEVTGTCIRIGGNLVFRPDKGFEGQPPEGMPSPDVARSEGDSLSATASTSTARSR